MSAAEFNFDHYVYWCYDEAGTLLYVGRTSDPASRIYMHSGYYGSEWMWRYCTTVRVSPGMAKPAAAALEREQIRALGPLFNKHHNVSPGTTAPVEKEIGSSPSLLPLTEAA